MNLKIRCRPGKWTRWTLKCCNIIDEPSDVLVCSANVTLNLSGGVGADLLERYGLAMQRELHRRIASRTPRAAHVGEVVAYCGSEIPYKAILHVVAIDGWYHSTPSIVREAVRRALDAAGGFGAKKVTLTALATGFGDLTIAGFAEAISPLVDVDVGLIEEVSVCLMEDYRLAELASHLQASDDATKVMTQPTARRVPPV
jgi:O-acetyl-ADP-ribose deacetylase (regulator of RNase III)